MYGTYGALDGRGQGYAPRLQGTSLHAEHCMPTREKSATSPGVLERDDALDSVLRALAGQFLSDEHVAGYPGQSLGITRVKSMSLMLLLHAYIANCYIQLPIPPFTT